MKHKNQNRKGRPAFQQLSLAVILALFFGQAQASDWPVYKGNLFLTGNNDELVVSNNRIKWIYRAENSIYNPIVSDHLVYIIDKSAKIHCLEEQTGKPVWILDLMAVSAEFTGVSRIAGKIKYPVISGRFLIISDSTMLYAIDKQTGDVIWSRTAWADEANQSANLPSRSKIEGIYSDPTIHNGKILYGTRNIFFARNLENGHLLWSRDDIHSYSAFPTFYGNSIYTQSMDYAKGEYLLHCVDMQTGQNRWVAVIDKPFKIFAPVFLKETVFIPSGKKMYAFDRTTGKVRWVKEYPGLISSEPSFTDSRLHFALDNSYLLATDPTNGAILERIEVGKGSAPKIVIIRDQLYIASNYSKKLADETLTFSKVRAIDLENPGKVNWEFQAPFPGSASQPSASGGILFYSAGRYLYALGGGRPGKIMETPGGFQFEQTAKNGETESKDLEDYFHDRQNIQPPPKPSEPARPPQKTAPDKPPLPMKDLDIRVKNKDGQDIGSEAEIIYRENGEELYRKKVKLKPGENKIEVPDKDGVEIIASSNDHIPGKTAIKKDDQKAEMKLDQVRQGESVVIDAVGFETNRAHLKPDALDILDEAVRLLRENPSMEIEVQGHTDSTGDDAYNQTLSEKRADAVRDYLIKQGIDPTRLTAKGFGETKPIGDNKTEDGRAKNRRTEFLILKR